MVEDSIKPRRLTWRLPLWAAVIEAALLVPLAWSHPDTEAWLSILLIIPFLLVFSLVLILMLIRAAIGYGRHRLLPILVALAILWVGPTSLTILERAHPFLLYEIREWIVGSRQLKEQVLLRPNFTNGDLKYIVWDGAGFAGIANRTVYLVYSSSDGLSSTANSRPLGKIAGIPCEITYVHRLESHWYYVVVWDDDCHEEAIPR